VTRIVSKADEGDVICKGKLSWVDLAPDIQIGKKAVCAAASCLLGDGDVALSVCKADGAPF
jgi:hypothetical protein